jgi:transcriptional regulator with XRE-family HTH domain
MKQYQIDRIKDLMDAKGITNQELASICNISSMTIGRLLTKTDYNPTTDTVEKIAEALGVHEQYIYEAEADTKSKIPLNGYIEFNGAISRIKTFKQLEKVYTDIKHDLETPKLAKSLKDQDKANRQTQSQQPIDITTIDLFKHEQYDTSIIYTWSFRKSDDEKEEMMNDLGNMCKGYPFKVNGVQFLNSECAYISGMFSQNTPKAIEIQKELQASDNGYEAKKAIRRKYEQVGLGREDWNTFNVQWMLYVVWQKVTQNKAFAEKLRMIPSYSMIVENSTFQKGETSVFWGMYNQAIKDAIPILEKAAEVESFTTKKKDMDRARMEARNSVNHIGVWEGCNCMGKILTICKHCLENGTEPPIDYELLREKKIYLIGELLTFNY